MNSTDAVNPDHYRNPDGVQLIDVIRPLPFSIGNAIKYVYRNERKNDSAEDLKKAIWYLKDYSNHPYSTVETEEFKDETLTQVLSGLSEWDAACCRALLLVYKRRDSDNFMKTVEACVKMITQRIEEKTAVVMG